MIKGRSEVFDEHEDENVGYVRFNVETLEFNWIFEENNAT